MQGDGRPPVGFSAPDSKSDRWVEIKHQAEAARQMGLTRARVSQLLDMTLLAPDVQERVLFAEGAAGVESEGLCGGSRLCGRWPSSAPR